MIGPFTCHLLQHGHPAVKNKPPRNRIFKNIPQVQPHASQIIHNIYVSGFAFFTHNTQAEDGKATRTLSNAPRDKATHLNAKETSHRWVSRSAVGGTQPLGVDNWPNLRVK